MNDTLSEFGRAGFELGQMMRQLAEQVFVEQFERLTDESRMTPTQRKGVRAPWRPAMMSESGRRE